MKTKQRTLYMRRAKENKLSRHQFLEAYLPRDEFALLEKIRVFD